MKLRRVRISPEMLAEFLTNPVPPGISSDAPADLKILNCLWIDHVIELLVSSATFDEPGDVLEPVPLWDIHFHKEAQ